MSKLVRSVIIVLLGLSACSGQDDEDYRNNGQSAVVSARKNKDVSILKQIHRHNEDGSYTYGYEGSDGSFKIETKTQTGEVSGKYGYVDDSGKLRVVEYGANKYGFQPSGEGITVPSPTLVQLNQEQDEDQEPEEEEQQPARPAKRPSARPPPPPQQQKTRSDDLVRQQQQRQHELQQHQQQLQQQLQLQREQDPVSNVQQQEQWQRQQEPVSNGVRSTAAEFDDFGSDGWTAAVPQKPATRPRAPSAGNFGGAPVRPPKSSPQVSGSFRAAPQVSGSFRAAPQVAGSFRAAPQDEQLQGPSGSFQSVQDFGGRTRAAAAVDRSYQTFEDPQEPGTEAAPVLFKAIAKPTARRTGGDNYRSAPRQTRPSSGILDQLAEQYALPQSGSPASHDFSFGQDN